MRMDKRVYGVIGIRATMANWNADFTGNPKSISDGTIYGSDKALKYTMKAMWNQEGKKVLYIKSMKLDEKNGLSPRSLSERYDYLFEHNLKADKTKGDEKTIRVLKNLFNAVDVKNFGATFAEEGMNLSITGAVQVGQGFNKDEQVNVEEQEILSPFRNSKNDDDKNSTLGTKIVTDRAFYFYPFVINPKVYAEFETLGVTDGYTEEDYKEFKRVAISSATSFASNSKVGCQTDFALFIETASDTYLPNFDSYIQLEDNVIKLNIQKILEPLGNQIEKIEIYYNSHLHVECDMGGTTKIDIITKEVL